MQDVNVSCYVVQKLFIFIMFKKKKDNSNEDVDENQMSSFLGLILIFTVSK